MPQFSDLGHFLASIMQVNVIDMGGAKASILGAPDANNDVVNNLKKNAIAFAEEYRKSKPDHIELIRNAEQVSGCLQTLQLTNTLSERTTLALLDELEKLMNKASG